MSYCGYSCSPSPKPSPLSPDSDITGIGIVINYIATASIAVFIILVYYLGIYQPNHDPFGGDDQADDFFRPNPVDEVFLRAVRWGPKHVLRWTFKSHRMSAKLRIRLQQIFINCLLAMSDLQIVTGLSILISGFVQLRCGLAVYHWLFIVKLAWFSCLTHLSCLTVLRSHLYRYSVERLWRLLAMGGLASFLVTGLLSTANIWSEEQDTNELMGSPAICHLWKYPGSQSFDIMFWSALVSALLISIAFVTRIIKLHKALSVGVFGHARSWLSIRARRILRVIFEWACKELHPHSLRRSLCYRPVLVIFLFARLICDGWSSVLFEVGWLVLTFLWGIWRVSSDLYTSESLISDWTFGQVVAVMLLAAPLITMMQYFNKDVKYSPTAGLESTSNQPTLHESQTHVLIPMSMDEELIDPESPDRDFGSYVIILKASVFYTFFSFVVWAGLVLLMSGPGNPLYGIISISYAFLFITTGMYGVVLFSLLIGVFKRCWWLRLLLQVVNISFFMLTAIFSVFASTRFDLAYPLDRIVNVSLFAQVGAFILYIMVALAYRFIPR